MSDMTASFFNDSANFNDNINQIFDLVKHLILRVINLEQKWYKMNLRRADLESGNEQKIKYIQYDVGVSSGAGGGTGRLEIENHRQSRASQYQGDQYDGGRLTYRKP
ncbi:MAG TPA: hypothetical protein VF920_14010 [Dongiaceae bacterium]